MADEDAAADCCKDCDPCCKDGSMFSVLAAFFFFSFFVIAIVAASLIHGPQYKDDHSPRPTNFDKIYDKQFIPLSFTAMSCVGFFLVFFELVVAQLNVKTVARENAKVKTTTPIRHYTFARKTGYALYLVGTVLGIATIVFAFIRRDFFEQQPRRLRSLTFKTRPARMIAAPRAVVPPTPVATADPLVRSMGRNLAGPEVRAKDQYSVHSGESFVPEVLFNGAWFPICANGFNLNWYGATEVCKTLLNSNFVIGRPFGSEDLSTDAIPIGECKNGQTLDTCEFQGENLWGNASTVKTDLCKANSGRGVRLLCFTEEHEVCNPDQYLSLDACGRDEQDNCCATCSEERDRCETSTYLTGCGHNFKGTCKPCPPPSSGAEHFLGDFDAMTTDHDGERVKMQYMRKGLVNDICPEICKDGFTYVYQKDGIDRFDDATPNVDADVGGIMCKPSSVEEEGIRAIMFIAIVFYVFALRFLWKDLERLKKLYASASSKQVLPRAQNKRITEKVQNKSNTDSTKNVPVGAPILTLSEKLKQLEEARGANLLSENEFEDTKRKLLSVFVIGPSVDTPEYAPPANSLVGSGANPTAMQNLIIERARQVGDSGV